MKSIWQKLHRIGDFLHLPDIPNWLVGILALIIILRIPSFFEPYYYGDEMIYLTLGQGVRQGQTLYKDVHDNKPPLIYLTAALAGNLFWFKAILAFWMLATTIIFYRFSQIVFKENIKGQKISTIIFALLTTLPLLEGNTVNAELFMIGPVILAFSILLKGELNFKKMFLAGALFGLASLFKVPAAFELPVIIVFWLMTNDFKNWTKVIKNSLILGLGFISPLLLIAAWYFVKGSLVIYIQAAYMQNANYISSWKYGAQKVPFLVKNASLLIRSGIVTLGLIAVFLFKKKISANYMFLSIWTLFAAFGVALSERPYPHYFIQLVPVVSILFAMLLSVKSLEQSLAVIPLSIAFFVPFYYKFWVYPTSTYYLRFIKFATKQISREVYFREFGKNTDRNYQIAEFLSQSTRVSDRVFMWDPDSSTVYALSKRLPPIKYVADYHIFDYSSTKELAEGLTMNMPKFIILTSDHPFQEIYPLLKANYIKIHEIGNAEIWSKVYNSSK